MPLPKCKPNPNSQSENRVTYAVKWIRDLPGGADDETRAVELWIVKTGGEKTRVRASLISLVKQLRSQNRVPDTTSDLDFLSQGMAPLLESGHFTHFEMAIAPMSPKKDKTQRIEFPPSAFEQGTTKGATPSKE